MDKPEENKRTPELVRDLMTVGVETCPPETPVLDLVRWFLEKGLEEVVVLEEGNALGVIGQDELIRAYLQPNCTALTAQDIFRAGVLQVPPDIPLQAAAQIMLDQRVRALFLMHHASGMEYPAAVITYKHLLRHFCAENGAELQDLGILAARKSPLETFLERREQARQSMSKRLEK